MCFKTVCTLFIIKCKLLLLLNMWRHERRLCVTNIITLDSPPTERKSDKTQNKEDSELFFCDGFMMLQTGAVNHLYIYISTKYQ